MNHEQDWKPVVFRKQRKVEKKPSLSNQARKSSKVDREEVGKPPKITRKEGSAISKLRLAKGLTQSQLAGLVNVKPGFIKNCEAGRAQKDEVVMQRLRRVLGKLT